jgi:DNA (cytosine-5)-methyltransferase 1
MNSIMATAFRKAARRALVEVNLGRRIAENILANQIRPFSSSAGSIDVVDLFAGCGGLSSGFSLFTALNPVFRHAGAVDIEPEAIRTYATNLGHEPMREDVHQIVTDRTAWRRFTRKLDRKKGNRLIVVGGPPCQGFSSHRITIAGCETMNTLVPDFARAAIRLSADVVLMENVPELVTTRSWPFYQEAAELLRAKGYTVRTRIYNFAGFGLPQERFRVVTLAMKKSFAMPSAFLRREEYRTVRSVIGHLPEIEPGVPSPGDPEHVTAKHRSSTVATIAAVPKNGGRRPLDQGPDCLRRLAERNGRTGYDDVYGRLFWDRASVTITGHSRNPASGRFSHPEQNRGISVREAALIQGFPPNFRFVGSFDSRFLQVGNAVSPIVAAFFAGHIFDELESDEPIIFDLDRDITKPVGTSFSRLIPGIKSGSLEL